MGATKRKSGNNSLVQLARTAFISVLTIAILVPAAAQAPFSQREQYCFELERQLARDWSPKSQAREQIPQLKEEIRNYDRIYHKARLHADRLNCYQSNFLFGTSLRKTQSCIDIDREIREVRQKLQQLNSAYQSLVQPGRRRARQDEIIQELSRYNCGEQYVREARKRSFNNNPFSFFGDSFFGTQPQYTRPRHGAERLPFSTYRTLCVRECDGYYYPVSFSTFPSQFDRDANLCQSRCAAPAQLYVYQNPGEDVQQMVTLGGQPYSDHPNAWKYRKIFVKGCSCKQTEYDPVEIEKSASRKSEFVDPDHQSSTRQFATSEPTDP
jgi:HPt (histidine-containing phosphotransfer) domain-containing protein